MDEFCPFFREFQLCLLGPGELKPAPCIGAGLLLKALDLPLVIPDDRLNRVIVGSSLLLMREAVDHQVVNLPGLDSNGVGEFFLIHKIVSAITLRSSVAREVSHWCVPLDARAVKDP